MSFSNFKVSCGPYLYKGTLTFTPLSLLNCDLFTLGVQILVTAPEIYVRYGSWMCQLIIYCSGCIVDLVVLLVYYLDCVDRSGSLSGGAFNQLRLATLNILTILYLLKTVLQGSLLQCLNSLYKSDEVF